jgi:hypothetical protein
MRLVLLLWTPLSMAKATFPNGLCACRDVETAIEA